MRDSDYHGYPDGIPQPAASGGVDLLRKRRGGERVTFGDVADHVTDYMKLHPPAFETLDAFARYLAELENDHHANEA